MYRLIKPNPYQDVANALPTRTEDAGIVFVGGRPAFEPRSAGSVGRNAGHVARRALHADDTVEGPDGVRTMVRQDAWAAADRAYASELSQTLSLNGLGRAVAYARPSGSTLRNVRVARIPSQQDLPISHLRGLGAAEWFDTTDWAGSCASFDVAKYGPPVVGFLFQQYSDNPQVVFRVALDAAAAVFGPQPVGCVLTASRAVEPATGTGVAILDAVGLSAAAPVAKMAAGLGMSPDDVVRSCKAAMRMQKLGRWTDTWDTSWWLLSGYTPVYKNPLAVAAAALAGMGGYALYKKKRRK